MPFSDLHLSLFANRCLFALFHCQLWTAVHKFDHESGSGSFFFLTSFPQRIFSLFSTLRFSHLWTSRTEAQNTCTVPSSSRGAKLIVCAQRRKLLVRSLCFFIYETQACPSHILNSFVSCRKRLSR